MPAIYIPKEAVSGFQLILELNKDYITKISEYLSKARVLSNVNDFFSDFDAFLKSDLNLNNSKDIVSTIAGFIRLSKEDNYEKIAEDLSSSFKELHATDISEDELSTLKYNLELILKSSDNLQLTLKAHDLKTENVNIYKKSKVISDVRIIFNKDMEQKERKAVLVHNLHITYKSNSKNKNFFVTLDLDDLKLLQGQIERAILKDKIIQRDYVNLELI